MKTCVYIFQYLRDDKNLLLTTKNIRQLSKEPWGFKLKAIDESIDKLPQTEDEEIDCNQFATFMH